MRAFSWSSLILGLVVCLCLASKITNANKAPNKKATAAPQPIFKSVGVCRYIQRDLGWFNCHAKTCVDGEYMKWPAYRSARKNCQTSCVGVSNSAQRCKYGDVFIAGRSGSSLNLVCQCSGVSSSNTCRSMTMPLGKLLQGRKVNLMNGKNACKAWCLNRTRYTEKNSDHCEKFLVRVKPPGYPADSPLPKPWPIGKYTCQCDGDNTAEDEGGELVMPDVF